MSQYTATLVTVPAKQLVGMKVLTSMQKAQADCPALWMSFGSRMAELCADNAGKCECKGSYGICVMINEQDFYYWAAVEMDNTMSVPAGMERIDIAAGQYASCKAPNLEQLGPVYMYLYETWPNSQAEYTFAHAPCFEYYGPNWQMSDPLEVFMPVQKK